MMSNFILEQYIDTELCKEIVKDFNSKDPSWTNSTRGYWLIGSNNMDPSLMLRYKEQIYEVLGTYVKNFSEAFDGFANLELTEPFNIQRYDVNHHYSRWHCENNGHKMFQNRVLAFMTYLNDVTDGGETEFLYQNVKSKPKTGKTLIWPAYYTHTHRGAPSSSNVKYIVTGWVEVEHWKDVDLDESDEDFYRKLDTVDFVSKYI
jgi:hypothetical protein